MTDSDIIAWEITISYDMLLMSCTAEIFEMQTAKHVFTMASISADNTGLNPVVSITQ